MRATSRKISIPARNADGISVCMSPAGGQVHFKMMRQKAAEHPSEKIGAEIRKLYSWNKEEDKLINN